MVVSNSRIDEMSESVGFLLMGGYFSVAAVSAEVTSLDF